MAYQANETRYQLTPYQKCGESGLKLPAVSLGLWHNFGDTGNFETMRQMCFTAFDNGITHFDIANNYGPPAGSAEKNFGKILHEDMKAYRENPAEFKGSVADVSMFLRVAVTGRNNSPDMHAVMQTLGEERVRARINAMLETLK